MSCFKPYVFKIENKTRVCYHPLMNQLIYLQNEQK